MELRRRGAGGVSNGASPRKNDYQDLTDGKGKRSVEALGFRHWFVVVLYVAVIYAAVVVLHRSLPPVVPGDNLSQFSEVRARDVLKRLTALGPRPSGSHALEKEAFDILQGNISQISSEISRIGANRLDVDVQRPTGCFDLKFLSSFTLCYYKITNLVVRIGPKSGPTEHSLMLNCHYDTMPDTPGATDDAVSCAIMMDVLNVLAQSNTPLKHDVVFLFNGAEENFLQGAHGFIETHPWRHSIRAFINLEGTGSGGREILFQAGPGNSWLIQTYLENAPHPFCSVLAQEIFQSGVIPSDTDFRIFRDYGRVSGLDIAYTKNGWFYHTEFDEEWRIDEGSLQRAGENVLAVVKAILDGPYLAQPGKFEEANKWVFYDVVGLFTIYYSVTFGEIMNYATCLAVLLVILYRLYADIYSTTDFAMAFIRNMSALLAMTLVLALLIGAVVVNDLVMCWYKMPELIGGLYVLPLILTGAAVHSWYADRNTTRNVEMAQFDCVLALFSLLLFTLTARGIASSFYVLIYVMFPFLKDPTIFFLAKLGFIKRVTPNVILCTQLVCFVPVIVFATYGISQCVDFFVPVMGRLGNAVLPELVMGPLSLVIAYSFVLFFNNLFYVSRRFNYLIKCGFVVFVFFFIALCTTRLGNPYEYSHENPRLRRAIILHTNRTIRDFDGNIAKQDNGLFVQSLDYRGASDLPAHSFLSGSSVPNCTGIRDEYCRLPYYTAIHELFPPEQSLWVPVPSPAPVPYPIELKVINKEKIGSDQLNVTFELRGGYDKMSLHITPLADYEMLNWSFTPIDLDEFGRRQTYFVFLTYGFEKPEVRNFWVVLQNKGSAPAADPNTSPNVEVSVASHHAHGKYQNSDTLMQLRNLVASRRQTPEMALGWWKWGITLISGVSEIVVYVF